MKFTQLQNQEQTVLPTIGSGNLHAVKKILYVSCDYFFFFYNQSYKYKTVEIVLIIKCLLNWKTLHEF